MTTVREVRLAASSFVILLLLLGPALVESQASVQERFFTGVLQADSEWTGIRVAVPRGATLSSVRLSIRRYGLAERQVPVNAALDGGLFLRVQSDSGPLEITIQSPIRASTLGGVLQIRGRQDSLRLFETAPADTTSLRKFAGEYWFGPGRLLYVIVQGTSLHYVDLTSGRRGWLQPIPSSPSRFIEIAPYGRSALNEQAHLEVSFELGASERMSKLVWRERGMERRLATRESLRTEDVQYRSGSAILSGTLYFPRGKGPFPGLVLRGGAGRLTREAWGYVARFFVQQGFVVLSADKRGVGKSSGSFDSATYAQFGEDEFAALRLLRSRKDIDPARIGIWGHSEGSWIAPIANVLAKQAGLAPSFTILSAAISIPPWQQNLYQARTLPAAEGESEKTVRDIVRIQALMYAAVASPEKSWAQYRAALERLKGASWLPNWSDSTSNRESFLMTNADLFFDPTSWLRQLSGPVLVLLGECDHTVPVEESSVQFRQLFAGRRNLDYSVEIIPRMGHGLQDDCGDTNRRGLMVRGYSAEYFTRLKEWLSAHGLAGDPR